MPFQTLKQDISILLKNEDISSSEKLTRVCEILQSNVSYYDWVGFYFAMQDKAFLELKAFAGEATDHTIIPFGKGICGQVAVSNQNFVVPDVHAQDNYLACSIHVKAEIVVPLFKDGKNIGQIDIDSHTANPFSEADEPFLEWLNQEVAKIL